LVGPQGSLKSAVEKLTDGQNVSNQRTEITIKQVSDDKMKELLTAHLEETKGQVLRLRTIFAVEQV